MGPDGMYEYDLFAVINHEGQMNNGHYTNFARFGDEVTFSYSVGRTQKLMCFYATLSNSGTVSTMTSQSSILRLLSVI